MGKHRDEIWQELCDLDNRVTRLEDRAILKPEYDPADVAFNRAKPWEWQVPTAAPVDELAALRAENARLRAERDALKSRAQCWRAIVDVLNDIAHGWQDESDNHEQAAIAVIYALKAENEALKDEAFRANHQANEYRDECKRLVAEIKAAQDQKNDDRFMLLGEWNKAAAERDDLRGAMAAQDQRERAAGEKCGVPYELHGCDWPDAVAEEVQAVIRERDAAIAERDALRARIEAGRVMYGGMYGHQNKFEMWTFEHVYTDTMTARLIDIAPIADHIADAGKMVDERKGERRVPDEFNEKAWDSSMRVREGRRFSNTNDRRRTTGTRADRKAGSNE